mgnify:CR=1 FL=1
MDKTDTIEAWYGDTTYDAALPQKWVNRMTERGMDPRGHFVTLYPKEGMEYIAPITATGVRYAAIVATYAA